MTYSNERDPLDELFQVNPARPGTGYSDDIQESPLPPLPSPEVKTPVKLRPPDPNRPPSLPTPSPHSPASPASTRIVEDEEFISLGNEPDFSDFDFPPAEPPTLAAPQEKKPVFRPVPRETPLPRSPAPEASAAAPAIPPSAPGEPTHGKPSRRDIAFASDQTLSHQDRTGSLLQTHGLVKIYDGRTVVNGVDIHVRPGEIVGLLGPNGAGKTTSFYMIVGLVPPNGGQVLFNGNDVTTMPMYQRARLGMGYLPQEESIFRKLTVEENLLAVLETLNLTRKERLARCQELLERFSITHIRRNVALTCSGGEKRRLTIARSLVTMPSLLMLDEPFSGVDPIAVNEIQNIVDDLRKSGLAILITDHNARQTLELVDRAYLIYEGRVLREGTRDFLINDPVSRELYLGDRFTM